MRALVAAPLFLLPVAASAAPSLADVYTFTGMPDGNGPGVTLAADHAGNLFGTTYHGGSADGGTIFKLSPPAAGQTSWTETQLYALGVTRPNTTVPYGLTRDARGNLFGLTGNGGFHHCGTAFELHKLGKNWRYQEIFRFSPGLACSPIQALTIGKDGALYGDDLFGEVFRLAPPSSSPGTWTATQLAVVGVYNGLSPQLAFDAEGNLYGTGFTSGSSAGYVWRLTPPASAGGAWTLSTLYAFRGRKDCDDPEGAMALDAAGRLYGTCYAGGESGNGAIWQLTPPTSGGTPWSERLLYSFRNGNDGALPRSGVVLAGNGALEGTTSGFVQTPGTVFALHPPAAGGTHWTLQTLGQFNYTNGGGPGLPVPVRGKIFGTAGYGSTNDGVVWEAKP